MRKQFLTLFVLLGVYVHAQEGTNTTGGDATGLGGSVSYTVGQLDYLVSEDTLAEGDVMRMAGPAPGSASQGIQQAEIGSQSAMVKADTCSEISTGPNPAVDFLDVSITNSSGVSIEYSLSDASGKVILNGSSSSAQFRIDLQSIASGNYILSFTRDAQEIRNQTILISK